MTMTAIFAEESLPVPTPITGEALLYNLISTRPISTGIRKLDELLGGGLDKLMIEVYGKSNSGKTQLCHKIMSFISCREEMDISGLYIDLHNDFSATRLLQFCQNRRFRGIDNVRVVRGSGIDGLMEILNYLEKELCHSSSQFFEKLRLVIIDALPFALYTVMNWKDAGRRDMQEKLVMSLRRLVLNHGLSIIVINHAVTLYSDSLSGIGQNSSKKSSRGIKPALGKYWSHVPNFRIYLSRRSDDVDVIDPPTITPSSLGPPPTPASMKDHCFRATVEKSGHDQLNRYFDFTITDENIL